MLMLLPRESKDCTCVFTVITEMVCPFWRALELLRRRATAIGSARAIRYSRVNTYWANRKGMD